MAALTCLLLLCLPSAANSNGTWVVDAERGSQYRLLPQFKLSAHRGARDICLSLGGFLPEPRTPGDNRFLGRLTNSSSTYLAEWLWLGVTSNQSVSPGDAERGNIQSGWRWASDNSPVMTSPEVRPGHGACMTLRPPSRDTDFLVTWWPRECDRPAGVVCQQRVGVSPGQQTTDVPPGDDDMDFVAWAAAAACGAILAFFCIGVLALCKSRSSWNSLGHLRGRLADSPKRYQLDGDQATYTVSDPTGSSMPSRTIAESEGSDSLWSTPSVIKARKKKLAATQQHLLNLSHVNGNPGAATSVTTMNTSKISSGLSFVPQCVISFWSRIKPSRTNKQDHSEFFPSRSTKQDRRGTNVDIFSESTDTKTSSISKEESPLKKEHGLSVPTQHHIKQPLPPAVDAGRTTGDQSANKWKLFGFIRGKKNEQDGDKTAQSGQDSEFVVNEFGEKVRRKKKGSSVDYVQSSQSSDTERPSLYNEEPTSKKVSTLAVPRHHGTDPASPGTPSSGRTLTSSQSQWSSGTTSKFTACLSFLKNSLIAGKRYKLDQDVSDQLGTTGNHKRRRGTPVDTPDQPSGTTDSEWSVPSTLEPSTDERKVQEVSAPTKHKTKRTSNHSPDSGRNSKSSGASGNLLKRPSNLTATTTASGGATTDASSADRNNVLSSATSLFTAWKLPVYRNSHSPRQPHPKSPPPPQESHPKSPPPPQESHPKSPPRRPPI